MLEGETSQTLAYQQSFLQERVLPDLSGNIKCGNSLVGPDFYDIEGATELGEDELYEVNVLDWREEFSDVMKAGGFDAVIGNPPYVRMETFVALKNYLRGAYDVYDERTDLYAYIIEASLKLLKEGGLFAMIVSNKFIKANYGKRLRNKIRSTGVLERIVDFAGAPVFRGATVRTLILKIRVGKHDQGLIQYSPPPGVVDFEQLTIGRVTVADYIASTSYGVDPSSWANDDWVFERSNMLSIRAKLEANSVALAEWLDVPICYGVKSGLVEAFIVDTKKGGELRAASPICMNIVKPYVIGREVLRYTAISRHSDIIYTPRGVDISGCTSIIQHLQPFKERLLRRATKQEWYELQQAQERYVGLMVKPKIVYPDIAKTCRFTLDEEGHICGDTTFAIPMADKALLGLLNSKAAFFYFRMVCAALEGAEESYLRFKLQYVSNFPVPANLMNTRSALELLVERMLDLNKRIPEARTPQDKTVIQRQIEATDKQIDKLVYELYGLTDEEIAIVEEATKR